MSLLCCSGQGIPKSFSNSCTSFFISPNRLLGTPNIGIKCSQFRSSLTVCWEIELLIDHHFLHTDSHLSAWWPEMQIIYRNHLDQCLEIGLSVDATITRKYLLNNLIIVNWWWARAIPRRQLINKWVVSPPLLSPPLSPHAQLGITFLLDLGSADWTCGDADTGLAGSILLFSVEKV